ncbi:MAG: hypothetical protein SGPRY_008706 [Prymnesium sp.]
MLNQLLSARHSAAREIQHASQQADLQDDKSGDVSAGESGEVPRETQHTIWYHLWALCPKSYLFAGVACSLLLTAASFGTPYVQGVLFDVAVSATFNNGTTVEETWEEQVGGVLTTLLHYMTFFSRSSMGIT